MSTWFMDGPKIILIRIILVNEIEKFDFSRKNKRLSFLRENVFSDMLNKC